MSTRHCRIGLPWPSLIGLLLLLFRVGSSHAAGNDPWAPFEVPWFDKVSSNKGLPPSIITALAQDRQDLLQARHR